MVKGKKAKETTWEQISDVKLRYMKDTKTGFIEMINSHPNKWSSWVEVLIPDDDVERIDLGIVSTQETAMKLVEAYLGE